MRQVFVYPGNGDVHPVIDLHYFTHGVGLSENRFGSRGGQQNRTRIAQAIPGTLYHFQRQQFRRRLLHEFSFLRQLLITNGKNMIPQPVRYKDVFESMAIDGTQFVRQGLGHTATSIDGPAQMLVLHHPRNPVIVRIVLVIRVFIPDPQADQQRHRHPHR